MENFLENSRVAYDHKRFPKLWQVVISACLMQFVGTLFFSVISVLTGGNLESLFRTDFGYDMFSGLVSSLCSVLLIPLFFLLVFKLDFPNTLRLKKGIDFYQLLLLAVISFGLFFFAQTINQYFVYYLTGIFGESSDAGQLADATNISQLLFEIVIVAGLPAICEEIFFRGFIMRGLERYSPVKAILLSSIIFAVAHGNLQQLVYAFILGIVFGTFVTLTDSLLPGIIMHFILNATSVLLSYPPIYSGYEAFVTDYQEIYALAALVVLPMFAAGAIVLFVIHTIRKNKKTYGFAFVSELKYPSLMPKQSGGQKVIYILGWIALIVLNLFFALLTWFADKLTVI